MPSSSLTCVSCGGFSSSSIAPFFKSSTSRSLKSQRSRDLAARALSTEEPEPILQKSSKKKPPGTGFGESQSTSPKKKSSKSPNPPGEVPDTSSSSGIRRRPAPTKPFVAPPPDPQTQQLETIAEITLLGLVGVVILEGLALAASGFLPEEWDEFLVKTVYPSFTPTIGLFVALAAGYGLYKYFGGQKKG
ncbi:protein LOW PSII ACCUMULATION 2, chloroplastic-like [Selaginella moellendorffii]|uniref:protein LOW PSII ACCUMULATION 2, chloroplastic-like n=1 Tax=Selaginella moellendorffii TaxID=88036 RepID=UPI000D1C2506|nr:protein LOW PSII ACCUMULATION 2, chloroplastic-like [Selaginella moellendorffii]|eukprot:XP_024533501.1 protein LOW PSII ACCUMULATION 2, chloroplastic-like [Selaginella moellendorffii]